MASTFVPAVEWLGRYERRWLRADVVAGLTTAAVVIPKAMAYATIAGLPVQVGLYTAFVPMAGLRRSSARRACSASARPPRSPSSRASALGARRAGRRPGSLVTASATLAVLVGPILLLAGLLRLGFVANFISEPVLTGFKAGIGLVIVVDQIPKLLGIHIDKAGFFRDVVSIVRHLPEARCRR